MIVEVPWNLTNQRHTVRLELIDLDGSPVTPIGDEEPKWIEAQFEVGRPPGLRPGTMIPFPVAMNHGPMPLEPGHYEWRWAIDGRAHADWRLAFSAMPDTQARAA